MWVVCMRILKKTEIDEDEKRREYVDHVRLMECVGVGSCWRWWVELSWSLSSFCFSYLHTYTIYLYLITPNEAQFQCEPIWSTKCLFLLVLFSCSASKLYCSWFLVFLSNTYIYIPTIQLHYHHHHHHRHFRFCHLFFFLLTKFSHLLPNTYNTQQATQLNCISFSDNI